MDISAIRLRNLDLVIDQHFQGKKASLANAIGVSPNNISRYYSANPSHRRSISDETARAIEKALQMEYGWMDQDHAKDVKAPRSTPEAVKTPQGGDKFQALLTLGKLIEDFTPAELSELRAQVELIRRRKDGGF